MAFSLHFWKKVIILIFLCEALLSKEIYVKTNKFFNKISEEIQILPSEMEGKGISLEIDSDIEGKLEGILKNIGSFKVVLLNFKGIEDPEKYSYLIKSFSIKAKTENPNLRIFLTGRLEGFKEDVEWFVDGMEGAEYFSHLLIKTDKGLKEWLILQSPFLIIDSPEEKEFSFFYNNLREDFFFSDFLKVFPEEIIPVLKEDLSFYLIVPPSFKGKIFIPGEYFKGAKNLKGEEIEVKVERDGTTINYENGEEFELLSLEREKGSIFYGREELKKEKTYSIFEVLSKLNLYFYRANYLFPDYRASSSTNLNISFGGITKPYHLKIFGEMQFEKGEEKLWIWDRVELEGAVYKGKDFPPIPVIQPEKVKINPFYLYPREEYSYEIIKIEEERIILVFKPLKENIRREIPLYEGKIYLWKEDFFPERIERVQLNLRNEFLSMEEELFFEGVEGVPILKRYKSNQSLSILGGITYVEVESSFENFERIEEKALPEDRIYYIRDEKGWRPSKDFPKRFLTFGLLVSPDGDFPLPLGGLSWISLDPENQYNFIFAGILGFFNKTYFKKSVSFSIDGFFLLYPFSDYPYRNGKKVQKEGVEIRPLSFNLSSTLPLNKFLNFQLKLGSNYLHFEGAEEKDENYKTPPSIFNLSEEISLNFSKKGYSFSIKGEVFQRNKDFRFGYEKREGFSNGKKWGMVSGKNFKIKNSFLHLDFGYYEGKDLDRFSSYKSGIFGGLEMEGFPSGSISSDKIFVSHLNYNFPFLFSKNINVGLDYIRDLREEKDYYSMKFSTFFNFLHNFLMQIQGGIGLKGEGKGISIRALFFKAI